MLTRLTPSLLCRESDRVEVIFPFSNTFFFLIDKGALEEYVSTLQPPAKPDAVREFDLPLTIVFVFPYATPHVVL